MSRICVSFVGTAGSFYANLEALKVVLKVRVVSKVGQQFDCAVSKWVETFENPQRWAGAYQESAPRAAKEAAWQAYCHQLVTWQWYEW